MLKFYTGQMASGKSLRLLATAYNFQEHNIPFILFKSEIDTRDGENVIHSRALGDRPCVSLSKEDNIFQKVKDEIKNGNSLKYVLVDEAQFLTVKQVEELAAVSDILNIDVYCYGLKTDFKTNLFPASKRLLEISDEFEQIDSVCKCGRKTMFNARINKNKEIVTNGSQIEVGGDDRYVAVCRKCYFEATGNKMYLKED